MDQLPIFVNLSGTKVILLGSGAAAQAKRTLIERAGGICVPDCHAAQCTCARLAFIAMDDNSNAAREANRLRDKGLLVNVVDQPDLCDFTTPAIVDRAPVLIAVGTGGASAGMAKAIRARIETLLPQNLGQLAKTIAASRASIRARWPTAADRRRALDSAFQQNGPLDPFGESNTESVQQWIISNTAEPKSGLITIDLGSNDPDDLTLRTARLLGEADEIYHDASVAPNLLARARADALRHVGPPPAALPAGLILYLRLP